MWIAASAMEYVSLVTQDRHFDQAEGLLLADELVLD